MISTKVDPLLIMMEEDCGRLQAGILAKEITKLVRDYDIDISIRLRQPKPTEAMAQSVNAQ